MLLLMEFGEGGLGAAAGGAELGVLAGETAHDLALGPDLRSERLDLTLGRQDPEGFSFCTAVHQGRPVEDVAVRRRDRGGGPPPRPHSLVERTRQPAVLERGAYRRRPIALHADDVDERHESSVRRHRSRRTFLTGFHDEEPGPTYTVASHQRQAGFGVGP